MSSKTQVSGDPVGTKKRKLISLPFIVVAGLVLAIGYFAGPQIMTYVMYMQEESRKAQTPLIEKDVIHPRPEGLSFGSDNEPPSRPSGESAPNEPPPVSNEPVAPPDPNADDR